MRDKAEQLLRAAALRAFYAGVRSFGPATADRPRPGPVTVSGFLNESLGVGRAGRLTVEALTAAGLSPQPHDLRSLWPHRPFTGAPAPCGDSGVWLLHCNPPEAVAALAKADRAQWRHVYRIGYWAYELAEAPAFWLRASDLFHEIWTPSTFVAKALAGARAPVRIMPHPVSVLQDGARPPELDPDKRHVLAIGDLRSSLARKNLLGAVRTFTSAFPQPRPDLRLVIKALTRGATTDGLEIVRAEIAGRDDIVLATRDMSEQETHALLAHVDVLLHPHRAEGFGLTIAEAFLLGTPVLATAYSGNMDFMSDAAELLIPYRMVDVADPDGVYGARRAQWAEPDIAFAAEKLRALIQDPSRAAKSVEAVRTKLAANLTWSADALAAAPLRRFVKP